MATYPMKPPARPQASTPPKTAQIKGEAYPVLNLQGKAYAPVHQRVESAHKHGGYTVISCEYKEIFELRVCEVWIEIDGKRFPGTAELKKNFDRPLEDAQTSAIGRALGFAGYDIQTAIASQEDMASVMQERGVHIVESAPAALPDPETTLRRESLIHGIKQLCKDYKMAFPEVDVYAITEEALEQIGRKMQREATKKDCMAKRESLKVPDDEWKALCESYRHSESKTINWESVWSALQTKEAEQTLPAGA